MAGKEGQMLGTAGLSLQGDTLEGGGSEREVRGKNRRKGADAYIQAGRQDADGLF